MNIILNNDSKPIEARIVTIVISEDVEFRISVNQFGEVEILKAQFGSGEGGLIIKPSVSNKIRLS